MPTRIDPTIKILTSQLTSTATKKGVEMIGRWEADLEKADWRGAKTVHEDLVKLRHHLEGGTPDGAVIAELLVKLGESTGRAAAHAKGDMGVQLSNLGQALVNAGQGLGAQRNALASD
jgi:hypothetical protein